MLAGAAQGVDKMGVMHSDRQRMHENMHKYDGDAHAAGQRDRGRYEDGRRRCDDRRRGRESLSPPRAMARLKAADKIALHMGLSKL